MSIAWALLWRTVGGDNQGDEDHAAELLESSRRHAERTGDPCFVGWIVKDIADAALRVGKVDDALSLIEESIDVLEPTGWNQSPGCCTHGGRPGGPCGGLALPKRWGHHRRALRIATDLGQPHTIADALEGMAEASAASQ